MRPPGLEWAQKRFLTPSVCCRTVADDGSYEDAETIEDADIIHSQIFADRRVVECKCCDRKLSAELEKKVIPADPPKAIAARTRKSERTLQICKCSLICLMMH